jgi:hypothetical protein
MEYEKYILVDYENVQDIIVDIITDTVKMIVIVGENQNKIPVSLIQKTQPHGESIEWLQIKSDGKKNALDFFVTYFLGYYTATKNSKEFVIYSKDRGYDPLINYLKQNNINVKRIVSFKQLEEVSVKKTQETASDEYTNSIAKITENLKKVQSAKRPKSKAGLLRHIKTFTKKTDEEIEKMIEEMFIKEIIYEANNQIKYNL